MAETGPGPSRSLKSFGVAGLLGENCRVYYQNVFSPDGIGRVSDLVSAKLAEAGADELRLRSVLLFGFFDAFRTAQPGAVRQPLADPVVVECGIDSESIAFGFSFRLPDGADFNSEGLEARIRDGKGEFERILASLSENCSRLCVKFSPKGRRIEIDAIIGIAVPGDAAATVEVLVFDGEPEETPGTSGYVELGDLDYSELVNQGAGPKVTASPAGVVLAGSIEVIGDEVRIGDLRRAAEGETRVGGAAPESGAIPVRGTPSAVDEAVRQVSGGVSDSQEGTRVAGTGEADTSQLVKGSAEIDDAASKVSGKAERFDESITIVRGGGEAGQDKAGSVAVGLADPAGATDKTAELYQRRISQLLERIQQLEREKAAGSGTVQGRRAGAIDVGEFAAPLPDFLKGGRGAANAETQTESESGDGEASLAKAISDELTGDSSGPKNDQAPVDSPATEDPGGSGETASDAGMPDATDSRPVSEAELTGEAEGAEEEPGPVRKIFESLISKVWPFAKPKDEESEIESVEPSPGDDGAGGAADPAVGTETGVPDDLDYKDVPDTGTALKSLMVEIETGGLEQSIAGLKKEAADLRSKSRSAQVRKFAEQMLKELSEEKAKLFLMARKLNWAVKKREMEVRNKEIALQEELKRRDELIKKKDILVGHTKSQMAQLNMNMERLKNNAQSAVEDQQYKKKYAHLQKLYESAKGESLRHLRELDRAKKQMASMKFSAAAQQTGAASGELDDLKGKHERTKRQLDEFKRMNKQLIDRIGHLERQKATAASPPGTAEMRDRLDQAMKAANAARAEAEDTRAKIAALEQERERMREMLRKAMDQMKRYVSSKKPPSSAA